MKLLLGVVSCGGEPLPPATGRTAFPQFGLAYIGGAPCCRSTAEVLFPGAALIALPLLRDYNYGTPPDMGAPTQKGGAPEDELSGAQGECVDRFAARCAHAVRQIVDEMNAEGVGSAAIVAHQAVVSAILRRYCTPRSLYRDWGTSPGKGYLLEFDSVRRMGKVLYRI